MRKLLQFLLLVGIVVWGGCDWEEVEEGSMFPSQGAIIDIQNGETLEFRWEASGEYTSLVNTKIRIYELKESKRKRSHEKFRAPIIMEREVKGNSFQFSTVEKSNLQEGKVIAWEVVGLDSLKNEVAIKNLTYFGLGDEIPNVYLDVLKPCPDVCERKVNRYPDCETEILIRVSCECTCPLCQSIHKVNGVINVSDGISKSFKLATPTNGNNRPCISYRESLELSGSFSVSVPLEDIDELGDSFFYTYLFENGIKMSNDIVEEEYLVNLDSTNIYNDIGFTISKNHYDTICVDNTFEMSAMIDLKLKFPTPDPENEYAIVVYLGTDFLHIPTPEIHDSTQKSLENDSLKHGLPEACKAIDRNLIEYYLCLDDSLDYHVSSHTLVSLDIKFCEY